MGERGIAGSMGAPRAEVIAGGSVELEAGGMLRGRREETIELDGVFEVVCGAGMRSDQVVRVGEVQRRWKS